MLRIAHLANPIIPIQRNALGSPNSISMMIYILTEGLLAQGVSVTLFAPTDSTTGAEVRGQHSSRTFRQRKISFDHPDDPRLQKVYNEHLEWVAQQLDEFDIIQNHSPQFLNFAHLTKRPILTTIHGPAANLALKWRRIPHNHFVAISHRQQQLARKINFVDVIHHGLPLDLYPFRPTPQPRRIAWLGRITPIKGADVVLSCASKLPDYDFHLAGNIEASELKQPYTKNVLKTMAKLPNVTWHGPIRFQKKLAFLQKAQAVLMPIQDIEAFGLVAIEALACGTPVIATAKGALPEIIEHGHSGFLIHNTKEMMTAIRASDQLDRRACRNRVETAFSQARMAKAYHHLYRRILKST